MERRTLEAVIGGDEYENQDEADKDVHKTMTDVVAEWAESNQRDKDADVNLMTPPKDSYKDSMTAKQREESIRHGYKLFSDPKGEASCINCHADYGRQVNFRYDDWGTLVRPMNLTTGVYRGGRRPIDLYWRIKGGIEPSGMPKTGLQDDKDRSGTW